MDVVRSLPWHRIGRAHTLLGRRPAFQKNKMEYVSKTRELAEFIQTRLPPNKPIAAFAIGQLAFQSRHPIIDTGGIVSPAVIPFANSLDLRLRWAQRQGA